MEGSHPCSHIEYLRDRSLDTFCSRCTQQTWVNWPQNWTWLLTSTDDTHARSGFSPGSESSRLQQRMEHSIDELACWMKSNRLLLSETDFLCCTTHRLSDQLSTNLLEVCRVCVAPTSMVHDLGVLLEADLQMTGHVRRTRQ